MLRRAGAAGNMDVCRNECLNSRLRCPERDTKTTMSVGHPLLWCYIGSRRHVWARSIPEDRRGYNSRECCPTRVLVSLMNVLPKSLDLICSESTYSSELQTQLKNGRAAGQTSPSVDVTARGDSERERAAKQGISSRASIRSVFLGSCNGWSPAIGPRQDKCMHRCMHKCQDIKTPLPPQILDKHSIPLIHG